MKAAGSNHVPAGDSGFTGLLEAPVIRRRILEYLGGAHHDTTCRFLGHLDPFNPSRFKRHPAGELDQLIGGGGEIARSLGDRRFFLVHLDIEYVNFDDPAAAYTQPERAFRLQEPLVRVIEERLLTLGIRYLHVVTGQGHHFVWKIRKGSAVAKAIARLGICNTPDLDTPPDPLFSHTALLMEHLAHLLKPPAAAACEVPVEITALHVGPGPSAAREMLSIDISEYGDPLDSRMIRIPFTVYRKPWASGLIRRLGIAGRVPEFFTLPLHEMDVMELIRRRHDPATILDLARRAPVRIPVEEKGMGCLLESYLSSGLAAFHRRFHARGHPYPSRRWQSLVAAAVRRLPPCARHVLEFSNDLLLKPSGMQLVTRCLLAQGWHPRHVSALVAARFLDPAFDWGSHWDDYDPVMRAEFYVRLFAGSIECGIERGVDFNCVSQQEKSFCWNPRDCNLAPLHARLYPSAKPQPPRP